MNKILLIASAFWATIGSLTAQNSIVDSVLTIADGTTEIKSQAFYGRKDFNKVVIPSTVTKIGGLAFHSCKNLKEIDIPSSVKEIGNAAFQNDSSLTKVTLHEGLTNLNYRVFKNTAIKEIIIPSSIDTIGKEAFSGCFNLQKVVIQNGVKKIDNNAFGSSTLKTIEIPASVSDFGTNIFSKCDSLTSIRADKYSDAHAFFNTDSLLSLTDNEPVQTKEEWIATTKYNILDDSILYIGHGITKIQDNQYANNQNIAEIRFSETLEKIGPGAFKNTDGIKKITIPGNVKIIGDGAFSGCSNLEEVIIEDGVEEIRVYAFYDCQKLNSVTMPKYVQKIVPDGLYWQNVSTRVFHCYAGSEAYRLAKKNGYTIEILGYDEQTSDTITHLDFSGNKTISSNAFQNCSAETVDLGPNIVEIGENAFNEKSKLRVKRDSYADTWAKENGYYLCGVLADVNIYSKDSSEQIEEDFTRILCDNDSYYNWTNYKIKVQQPLTVEEVDDKIVLTSFMLVPCKNVTVTKGGKTILSGKTIQPLTRTVLDDNSTSIEDFSIVSDDSLYQVFTNLKIDWTVMFNGSTIRKTETETTTHPLLPMYPVHCREWLATICNNAYVIASNEYKELCYKGVEEKWFVTNEEQTEFLTKEQMDTLLNKTSKRTLTLGHCNGGGLGSLNGNNIWLLSGWFTKLGQKEPHGFFHEFSHNMGWNHSDGNMCNLGAANGYGEKCWPMMATTIYKQFYTAGELPYNDIYILNSNCFSHEELNKPDPAKDVIIDSVLYIADGVPCVTSYKNQTDFTKVVIPSSVEVIKNSAFYGTKIKEIEIPSSIVKIENLAFHSCTDLDSINIPDNVKVIGDAAFQNDSSLTSVKIGSGLKELSYRIFKSSGLTEINIPANIKVIGKEAFADCKNLKTVVIADGVQKIDNNAFYNTGIEKIEVPASVTEFGKNITSKKVVWIVKRGSAAYYYALGNNYPIELLPEPEDEVVAQIIAESESAEYAPTEGWQTGDYTSGYERRRWDFSNELKGAGKYTITFKYTKGACMLCLADALFVADGNAIGHFFDMRSAGSNPRQIVYEITVPAGTEKLELLALAKTSGGIESNGTIKVEYLGGETSNILTNSTVNEIKIYNQNRIIIVENATDEISVYDILGQLICRYAMPTINTEIPVNKEGLYIVKTGNSIGKLYIK